MNGSLSPEQQRVLQQILSAPVGTERVGEQYLTQPTPGVDLASDVTLPGATVPLTRGQLEATKDFSLQLFEAVTGAAGAKGSSAAKPVTLAMTRNSKLPPRPNPARPFGTADERDENLLSWAGDTQVAHQPGDPKVVYHSTKGDFDVFDTQRGELGTHLGTIPQANARAGSYFSGPASIMPLYARIENPIRLEDHGGFNVARVQEQLRQRGLMTPELERKLYKLGQTHPGYATYEAEGTKILQDHLKSLGYDGVVYLNRVEGASKIGNSVPDSILHPDVSDTQALNAFPDMQDSYIVFDPNQVKSALGNSGAFSRRDDSIVKGLTPLLAAGGGAAMSKDDKK